MATFIRHHDCGAVERQREAAEWRAVELKRQVDQQMDELRILANALRKGYRIVEVPSHERARQGGVANSRVVKHGTKLALRVIREWRKGGFR